MAVIASIDVMQRMIAEWRIRDVVGRYARGVDRRDGSLICECFHPGALTHYGDFDGNVDTFVPWVQDFLKIYTRTMHFMGTSIIDWPRDGTRDFAIVETYAAVLHEKDADTAGRSWVGGIRYIDRFECHTVAAASEPVWRIAERTVVGDLLRIDPNENHRRFGKTMPVGQPGKGDPIVEILVQTIR